MKKNSWNWNYLWAVPSIAAAIWIGTSLGSFFGRKSVEVPQYTHTTLEESKYRLNSALDTLLSEEPETDLIQKQIIFPVESNRNVYVILNTHFRPDFAKTTNSNDDLDKITEGQVGVYRLLEHLYKKKELQVIAMEGIPFDDYTEVLDSTHWRDNTDTSYFDSLKSRVENGSDEKLTSIIKEISMDGAKLIGFFYSDLFVTGYERYSRVEEDKRSAQFFQGEIPLDSPAADSIMDSFFGSGKKQRSLDAITFGLQNCDSIYNMGLTKNRDFAIVIGAAHYPDFEDFARENPDRDYNIIAIFPKGYYRN